MAPRDGAAASKCQLGLVAELKVSFENRRPIFTARIDGKPVRVLVDTGAFTSLVRLESARRLGLSRTEGDLGEVSGVGGTRPSALVRLDSFEVAGVNFRKFPMMMADVRSDAFDVLMGLDFLARTDLELDLAHGVVRLLQPTNCASEQMPYWAEKGYSQAPLTRSGPNEYFRVDVRLNTSVVHAFIDSGAARSVASPQAASRARITLSAPAGSFSGIGPGTVEHRLGELDSFTLGDETIRRTRLQIADLFRGTGTVSLGSHVQRRSEGLPDMLLGADFLTSHRVLVSQTHKTVYFTYEGGPVFDVSPETKAKP